MSNFSTNGLDDKLIGYCYGIAAFIAWGFLPIYWKLLATVPAQEILAHRIFWSFAFMALMLFYLKRWHSLKGVLAGGKNLLIIILCAVLISINWFVYIWAVNSDQVIEASMGYYISPLISVLLGMALLKENLSPFQILALLLAVIGVGIITVQFGKIPWVALVLASSFAFYGLLKKLLPVDALLGLALETTYMMPLALAYIIFQELSGTGALAAVSPVVTILLIGSGVVTATPLLWFAKGAQKMELSAIGFLQYIGPSISLLLGIFIFKEEFSHVHLASFCFIWAGVILYSWSGLKQLKKQPKVQSPAST